MSKELVDGIGNSDAVGEAGDSCDAMTPDESHSLEQTIDVMKRTNACLNPVHYHAFQAVSFIIQQKKCCGCGQQLQSVLFGGGSQNAVVQCLSCKKYAHRSCGLSRTLQFEEVCPINSNLPEIQNNLEMENSSLIQEDGHRQAGGEEAARLLDENPSTDSDSNGQPQFSPSRSTVSKKSIFPLSTVNLLMSYRSEESKEPIVSKEENAEADRNISTSEVSCDDDKLSHCSKARFPFFSAAGLLRLKRPESVDQEGASDNTSTIEQGVNETTRATMSTSYDNSPQRITETNATTSDDDEGHKASEAERFEWTSEGPPKHWAPTSESASDIIALVPSPPADGQQADSPIDGDNEDSNEALHFTSQPFSSVSRALQEIIIAHFQPVVGKILSNESEKLSYAGARDSNDSEVVPQKGQEVGSVSTIERTPSTMSEAPSDAEVEGLLTEVTPNKPDSKASTRRKLGVAAVAGGVVGGVAGLVFAGPFGGVIGAKCGQTAGLLGVLLEGSVSIGVVASGVAVGRYTGEQLGDKFEEQRVLALGEHGTRRVLLVRPNVKTDPVWEEIYNEARQTQPKPNSRVMTFGLVRDEEALAKRERYEREADIVRTDEDEIPTADKVLLLASRILNDRLSLPGHVYRHLLASFRSRCDERGPLDVLVRDLQNTTAKEVDVIDESSEMLLEPHCARRRDCHAVIKYVTATLQEVRPGFASCPAMTELTATAVESLVFGEVYDLVIDVRTQMKSQTLLCYNWCWCTSVTILSLT